MGSLVALVRSQPSTLAKIIVAILSIFAFLLFDESQFHSSEDYLFVAAIGVESLVFINGISPYALFSVMLAKTLLAQEKYGTLVLGFIVAFAANLLSFYVGRIISDKAKPPRPVHFRSLLLTFWHPQFASIEAFDCGVRPSALRDYAFKAFLVASIYYMLACVVIATVPINLSSSAIFLISSILLVGWIIWELLVGKRA